MAMTSLARNLLTKPSSRTISSLFTRSFITSAPRSSSPFSTLLRFRPFIALAESRGISAPAVSSFRCFSSRPTTSSLNDPSPNWNNRPPKETILLDGCDFEHWLVVLEKPEGDPTRDEIIDSYIKTLAMVVGSEEEARQKIYSVSTRHYFAFGALVSEEVSYKIKELPKVRWVLPDSYLDVRNKDYGGEPFIDGQAVPYDTKYHEEWVRNNARANERSRRNDRPRNNDRSRNFERRRENMQNRDFNGPPNRGMPNAPPMTGGPPPPMGAGAPPPMGAGAPPPNANAPRQPNGNYQNMPPPNMGNMPPPNAPYNNASYMGNLPPNAPQYPPQNMGNGPNPNMQYNGQNYGGMQPNSNSQYNAVPPRDAGPHAGYSNMPNRDFQSRDVPNNGGGYQDRDPGSMPNRGYQNSYAPNNGNVGAGAPSGNSYQARDIPGRDTY